MIKNKNIISLLIFICLSFCCVTSVYAANSIVFSIGSETAAPGETVSIPISLESNSGFVSLSLSVTYDTSVLTLISCDDTGVIEGSSHSPHLSSPYILSWVNDTHTSNITNTGTIVYLTFLVNDDAACNDYSVIVRIPKDGIIDAYGNVVDANAAMGTITVSEEHMCTFGVWEEYSNTKHVSYCEICGKKKFASHNWDNGEIIEDATHTEGGQIRYTCKDCTYSKITDIYPEGHSYGDWEYHDEDLHARSCDCGESEYDEHWWEEDEITAPTCAEEGSITYVCAACDYSYQEEIPTTGHKYESVITEPTCTEVGCTTYTCTGCGDSYIADYVDAVGHAYNAVTIAPTCQDRGYTQYTCSNCGDSYKDDYVDPVDHVYQNGMCIYCGATDESNPDVTYEYDVALEAIDVVYSSSSGKPTIILITRNTGSKAVANISFEVRSGAPDGEWVTGSTFGGTIQPNETYISGIPSLGYELTSPEVYYIWLGIDDECDDNMSDNYLIVVLAPLDDEETCWMHGGLGIWESDGANGHVIECEDCGKTVRSDHWYTDESASTCVICGYENDEAHTHAYDTVVTKPTCTEWGYTTYTCVCGDSYVGEYVEPTGHSYDEGVVTQKPTCTEVGKITYICTGCGESYTEEISKISHNFVDGRCTECGETMSMLGDVNQDGRVDTTDAKLIMQYDLGLIDESVLVLTLADVNGDGLIDTTDAKFIMQLDLGIISKFPAP